MHRASLYFHTLRHLKPTQIGARLFNAARGALRRVNGHAYPCAVPAEGHLLRLVPTIERPVCWDGETFRFLNRSQRFAGGVDWNFDGFGKLWCYHLNYLDALNQPDVDRAAGIALLKTHVRSLPAIRDGRDPYPLSLRLVNAIKFLSRERVRDPEIEAGLYAQALELADKLEYHLLGNHLLENGFALLWAAYFFEDRRLFKTAAALVQGQLAEQLLPDGAHFELSPMYHQVVLEGVLDAFNLVAGNDAFGHDLIFLLQAKAATMLGWLHRVAFEGGAIPLFNDACNGVAPTTPDLTAYADRLGIAPAGGVLRNSGYRKAAAGPAELVVDVGEIGAAYIPGHAHADTLNFELAIAGRRVIVDSGTSTYEKDPERQRQRGTAAHNTVAVDDCNSSEVWGGFRVARRARPLGLVEAVKNGQTTIACAHDGYWRLPGRPTHRRMWALSHRDLKIRDRVFGTFAHATARYHFHPEVRLQPAGHPGTGTALLPDGRRLAWQVTAGAARLRAATYHPEFNLSVPNQCLEVAFESSEAEVVFAWEGKN